MAFVLCGLVGQGAQRGKPATEAMESSYGSGSDDHAGRRAAMALTRCEWCEENKESASEFAPSVRSISTIALQGATPVTTWAAPPGETVCVDYVLRVNDEPVPVYSCRVSAVPFDQV